MRKLLVIFILFAFIGNAQNWDVFNKDYRYNYKYDNSAVISNVLFAETVSGNFYSTNKIGVVTGTTLAIDQPQFLMKYIVKQANGNVVLQDPSYIIIIPTCSVSQTWTFDPNINFTATCVAISTLNIFSIVDSVKTIIVNNVDTVVLSKQFGIIQFPKLYAQNKYYRLVGIENKATYDLNSLFGEKVPNAWDFYDYQEGSVRCYVNDWSTGMPTAGGCKKTTQVVKTKFTTSNSYSYNIDDIFITGGMPGMCSPPPTTVTYTTVNTYLNYTNLDSPLLPENLYYPGKVIFNQTMQACVQIVGIGKDNTGRFYKYVGPSCQSFMSAPYEAGLSMPNLGAAPFYSLTFTPNPATYDQFVLKNHCWGEGMGKVSEYWGYFSVSGYNAFCAACFGTVGVPEFESERSIDLAYPNPSNTELNFSIDKGTAKIYDSQGKLVREEGIEGKKMVDISTMPNGLYFLEIQTDSFKSSQKLIIQH